MTIYIVVYPDGDRVEGVYLSKENAEKHAREIKGLMHESKRTYRFTE